MDTEPKPGPAAEMVEADSASTIEYYPEEGAEAEVEALPTGKAPELEAGPAQSPEAPQGQAPSPEPQAPGAPGPAPLESFQYREALAAQQQLQQQEAELNRLRLGQELAQLREVWTREGYSDDQIQQGLAQQRSFREREDALALREKTVERNAVLARGNDLAKIQVALMISQKFGMPFNDLMKFDSPQLMEAEARAYTAEAALAKTKQARVKPTALASVGPGSRGVTNLATLRKRYANGDTTLTSEQVASVVHRR